MGQITRPVLRAYEGFGSPEGEQQHRLQEIGAQAARVAHELKVPLSLIDGGLQMLEECTLGAAQQARMAAVPLDGTESASFPAEFDLSSPSQQAPALLNICRNGVRRLHLLVEQLEDYTRDVQRTVPHALVDLGGLLREAIALAACGRAALPPVHVDVGTTGPVCGDTHALSRVFINLIGNAFEAVADTVDPHVWVTLGIVEPGSASNATAVVHVCDNGPGVPAGMEAHIFRPFVTTKSGHSGLGLGLAIAKSIVEQSGGTLALVAPGGAAQGDAETQRGADFVVRLPVVLERPD